MKVVHMGDSIAYGECASAPSRAYPLVAARAIAAERHTAVDTCVIAQPGWTSWNLAQAVSADPAAFTGADVALMFVGGDDLIQAGLATLNGGRLRRQLAEAYARYARNFDRIAGACQRQGIPLVCCTLYNPFPRSPIAVAAVSGLNQVIVQRAMARGIPVAPVDAWFAGREPLVIAGYRSGRLEDILRGGEAPVHPNDLGHRLIGLGLARYISPLAEARHRLGSTAVSHSRR